MSYWGLYCPQCGVYQRTYDGSVYFYPAPEIAAGHIGNDKQEVNFPIHLWQPQEFGKEERIDRANLPSGAMICPMSNLKQDEYGSPMYVYEHKA